MSLVSSVRSFPRVTALHPHTLGFSQSGPFEHHTLNIPVKNESLEKWNSEAFQTGPRDSNIYEFDANEVNLHSYNSFDYDVANPRDQILHRACGMVMGSEREIEKMRTEDTQGLGQVHNVDGYDILKVSGKAYHKCEMKAEWSTGSEGFLFSSTDRDSSGLQRCQDRYYRKDSDCEMVGFAGSDGMALEILVSPGGAYTVFVAG